MSQTFAEQTSMMSGAWVASAAGRAAVQMLLRIYTP